MEKTEHEGRNVKRIREILGMKQDTLANELGLSQQAVSALEQKEALEKDMLEKIAGILKVTPESIRSFSDESVVNIISNTFTSNDTSTMNAISCFSPLDKVIELYERMLQQQKETIERLETLIKKP